MYFSDTVIAVVLISYVILNAVKNLFFRSFALLRMTNTRL